MGAEMSIEGVVLHRKRGVKKGQRHSGMFTKGKGAMRDPRINVEKPLAVVQQAQRLGAENLDAAFALLVTVMNDPTQPVKTRVDCSVHILNRAAGTPVSMSIHQELTDNNTDTPNTPRLAAVPASLTDDQLLAVIQSQIKQTAQEQSDRLHITPADEPITTEQEANENE